MKFVLIGAGQRGMVYGGWSVASGQWSVVSGQLAV